MDAKKVLEDLKRRFPNEPEYHQAVEEVLGTIEEEYNKHPEFDKVNLVERLCIPDRVYQFRVTWMDDKGQISSHSSRLSRTHSLHSQWVVVRVALTSLHVARATLR